MLVDFTPRLYQQKIFATTTKANTLVVLPTGLGKTAISLMLAMQRLSVYPRSKILIVAPTRPLLDQHKVSFERHLPADKNYVLHVVSGSVSPEKRQALYAEATFIFSTPQTIENDLIAGRLDLSSCSLLVVDEAHRAIGSYAYVFIAKRYTETAKYPRILSLTASPGSDLAKIREVVSNVFVEALEYRSDDDPDVKQYVQDVQVHYHSVALPDQFSNIHAALKKALKEKLQKIKDFGYLESAADMTKGELLRLQAGLQGQISQDRTMELMMSLSLVAEAMKIEHAIALIESQGLSPLCQYLRSLYDLAKSSKVKAVQNLAKDLNIKYAFMTANDLLRSGSLDYDHPKLEMLDALLAGLFEENPDAKCIIFTQFRDAGAMIQQHISALPLIRSSVFVGQATKKGKGMSQKEQARTLDEFRDGLYNVLIMTSVGEEGLDIPQVDTVLFYEPVPSAIRTVQRKGRTGRSAKGEVHVLMTKGTRDEAYRWSAYHKSKRMYRSLEKVQAELALQPQSRIDAAQQTLLSHPLAANTSHTSSALPQSLSSYLDTREEQRKQFRIYVDSRERNSSLAKALLSANLLIDVQRLDSADYVLSKDVAVEYKTVKDFVDSLVDGRLLDQIKRLKEQYRKPLVVVEGTDDIFTQRRVHPNAIHGMIASIIVGFQIPLLRTQSTAETAALFATIVRREQQEKEKTLQIHTAVKGTSIAAQQEYIVSSFPMIGPQLAKDILAIFGSLEAFFRATKEDLRHVPNLGPKKAQKIRELIEHKYGDT